jgi:hypothetical protein
MEVSLVKHRAKRTHVKQSKIRRTCRPRKYADSETGNIFLQKELQYQSQRSRTCEVYQRAHIACVLDGHARVYFNYAHIDQVYIYMDLLALAISEIQVWHSRYRTRWGK